MEEKVNEFLDSIDDQDVLDIQFQDSPTIWSVMIVYDESSFTKKTNK